MIFVVVLTDDEPGPCQFAIHPPGEYLSTDIQSSTEDTREKEPEVQDTEPPDHPCHGGQASVG